MTKHEYLIQYKDAPKWELTRMKSGIKMNFKYLVVYLDESGDQTSVPFYYLKWAKKFAKLVDGLIINLKG